MSDIKNTNKKLAEYVKNASKEEVLSLISRMAEERPELKEELKKSLEEIAKK